MEPLFRWKSLLLFCSMNWGLETRRRGAGHSIEVAERSLPGVGEEAAPGYSARVAMRALLGITYNLITI
jgi:hypothetical protein